jgi:hypothetical protein
MREIANERKGESSARQSTKLIDEAATARASSATTWRAGRWRKGRALAEAQDFSDCPARSCGKSDVRDAR